MGVALTQRHPQVAGTKTAYNVTPYAITLQCTIGGRASSTVAVRYRPSLSEKSKIEVSDFEVNGQGVTKRTFVLANICLSHIEIDDWFV